ncbi:MAG: prenyltransferase/squalene oxidase repeat-containing protein [Phycisphaerae bacterium]
MPIDHPQLDRTLQAARQRLLDARTQSGHWVGTLSSSALSTATAACALELLGRSRPEYQSLVSSALIWLADHQNRDGGWGDTPSSPSNISTTVLCWAALGVNPDLQRKHDLTGQRAERWIAERAGGLDPQCLALALGKVYGPDKTFSVPILTMCALSGRLGPDRQAWKFVPSLPFELAACPRSWFSRLGLPVVSYALPALIAIGQARHHRRPSSNPIARGLRNLLCSRTLRILADIQPAGGGFLEAAPLTSFVVMSLVSAGLADHPVVGRGAAFLTETVRDDGSWPIDTNLATWVTTLAINALSECGTGFQPVEPSAHLTDSDRARLRAWLLDQQYKTLHNYTQAAPGGWAWTDLSGGVPDADDTAGALLALKHLGDDVSRDDLHRAVTAGVGWLADLQNKDGGMPTFCRGWGKLPFDQSTPDLTAHALRAWSAWHTVLPHALQRRIATARTSAIRYLRRAQRDDGAWVPLWFGNQQAPQQQNPLYGTTRALLSLANLPDCDSMRRAGLDWLLTAQHADGGWGGHSSVQPSIEETALALEALTTLAQRHGDPTLTDAIAKGTAWLIENTASGTRFDPTPIGLYFAKLWYDERLYPLIFTVSALKRVQSTQSAAGPTQSPQPADVS